MITCKYDAIIRLKIFYSIKIEHVNIIRVSEKKIQTMKIILLISFLFLFSNFSLSQNSDIIVYDDRQYFRLPGDFDIGKAMYPSLYGEGYFEQFNLHDGDWILMSRSEGFENYPTLTGRILNSKPEGIWKMHSINWEDTTSCVTAEFQFRNGIIDGDYKGYFNDGKLRSVYEMKNNVYHGKSTHYSHNGNVTVSGMFEFGMKVGLWKYFNNDGELTGIESYVETIPADMKEVFSSPELFKEKFYRDDKSVTEEILRPGYDGVWINYHDRKILREKTYDNGLLVYYREFYPNGVVKLEGACKGEYPPKEMKKLYDPDEKYEAFVMTGTWIHRDETGSTIEVVER